MDMSKLFSPLKVGNLRLQNRLALAPLTRYRADDEWTPTPMMKEYYEHRACVPGTLLISEGTLISHRTAGRWNVPEIWIEEHVAGWREVTDAVHAKSLFIYCQLWHPGRDGKIDVCQQLGLNLEAPSAISITQDGPTSVELNEEDIAQTIRDYAQAARNAIKAGFLRRYILDISPAILCVSKRNDLVT